ncbi:MAG: DMT family transporter [Desulfovibrionaceae bacterium]|jgi:drug/metabolite transporter (DMT)-like permease|nr:DMT family transporter [Desulfovibrionaceae bacterium]
MLARFLTLLSRHPLSSVVAGSLMISFSAVFVKLVSVSPDTAAFYRVFFGGAGLLGLSLCLRERQRFPLRAVLLLVAAALSLGLDLTTWHRSIALVGPGLATICINFQVFLVALWGCAVHKEPLRLRVLVAMPMALLGLWLLVGVDTAGGPPSLPGVLLGLVAAAAFAAYILCIRASQSMADRLEPMSNMAVASLATAALLGAACGARGVSLAIPDLENGAWLLAYGLVSQGAGWLMISQGLPRLPASVGGVTILIMPTFSFIWDILFFARPTGLLGIVGAVLAIGAIWLGVSGPGAQAQPDAQAE